MDYLLILIGKSMEIGEFVVAHVWFQYYQKGYWYFEKLLLGTNSNPNDNLTPTPPLPIWTLTSEQNPEKIRIFVVFFLKTGRPR